MNSSDKFGRNLRRYREGDLRPGLRLTGQNMLGYFEIVEVLEPGISYPQVMTRRVGADTTEQSFQVGFNAFRVNDPSPSYYVWDHEPVFEYTASQEGDRDDDI